MTVDDIGTKLGVDKTVAYGLVRFLEAKGVLVVDGTTRKEGSRGKGSKIYKPVEGADDLMSELFKPLFEPDTTTD